MKKTELLNQILSVLQTIKEDEDKLQQVYDFVMDEIYEEEQQVVEIPEKYKKLVHEIADNITSGFVCYFKTWDNCIVFEPLESYDSFQIMKDFVSTVPEYLQNKLTDALNRSRPFAKFKNIIDNSEFRFDWFEFRHKRVKQIVFDNISNHI